MLYPPWGKIKHGAANQERFAAGKTPPGPNAYSKLTPRDGRRGNFHARRRGNPVSAHAAIQLAPPGLFFFSRSTNGVRISIGTGKTMVVLLSPAMLPRVCR